jgi:hypothetical protein
VQQGLLVSPVEDRRLSKNPQAMILEFVSLSFDKFLYIQEPPFFDTHDNRFKLALRSLGWILGILIFQEKPVVIPLPSIHIQAYTYVNTASGCSKPVHVTMTTEVKQH